MTTLPVVEGNRQLTLLTHEVVVRGTMLGGQVDSRITLTYHLDPATSAFTRHTSAIEQGLIPRSLRRQGFRLACQQEVKNNITLKLDKDPVTDDH